MPKGLLQRARAVVRLGAKVTRVHKHKGKWQVFADGVDPDEFDAVIIACPLHLANISLTGFDEGASASAVESCRPVDGSRRESATCVNDGARPGADIDYQTVFTTYVDGRLNVTHFGACDSARRRRGDAQRACQHLSAVPDFVGTTEGSGTPYTCVAAQFSPDSDHSGDGNRLYKLFSYVSLNASTLDQMFVAPRVVAEKYWKAYPVFVPPENQEGRMRLDQGLYYTNALEAGASCIEIAAIAARNVAMLAVSDVINSTA